MRHIVTSEAGKPGMTLDQLQEAIQQARRAGATGGEVVRARLYGRDGGLRSITVELDQPLVEPTPVGGGRKGGRGQGGGGRAEQQQDR